MAQAFTFRAFSAGNQKALFAPLALGTESTFRSSGARQLVRQRVYKHFAALRREKHFATLRRERLPRWNGQEFYGIQVYKDFVPLGPRTTCYQ
jgi:hypothetical protein